MTFAQYLREPQNISGALGRPRTGDLFISTALLVFRMDDGGIEPATSAE